jgi:hypothetical protein
MMHQKKFKCRLGHDTYKNCEWRKRTGKCIDECIWLEVHQ